MGLKDIRGQDVLRDSIKKFISHSNFDTLQQACNQRKHLPQIQADYERQIQDYKNENRLFIEAEFQRDAIERQREGDSKEERDDTSQQVQDETSLPFIQRKLEAQQQELTLLYQEQESLQRERLGLQQLQVAEQNLQNPICDPHVHDHHNTLPPHTHGHGQFGNAHTHTEFQIPVIEPHLHGHSYSLHSHSHGHDNPHSHTAPQGSVNFTSLRIATIDSRLQQIDQRKRELLRDNDSMQGKILAYPGRLADRNRRALLREQRAGANRIEDALSPDSLRELRWQLQIEQRKLDDLEKNLLSLGKDNYEAFLQVLITQVRETELPQPQKEELNNLAQFHQKLSLLEQSRKNLTGYVNQFHADQKSIGECHTRKESLVEKQGDLTTQLEDLTQEEEKKRRPRNKSLTRVLFSGLGLFFFVAIIVLASFIFSVPPVALVALGIPTLIGVITTVVLFFDAAMKYFKWVGKNSELKDVKSQASRTESELAFVNQKIENLEKKSPRLRERIEETNEDIREQERKLCEQFPLYTSENYQPTLWQKVKISSDEGSLSMEEVPSYSVEEASSYSG